MSSKNSFVVSEYPPPLMIQTDSFFFVTTHNFWPPKIVSSRKIYEKSRES